MENENIEKKNSTKKIVLIVAILILAIVLCIGGWILGTKSTKGEDKVSNSNSNSNKEQKNDIDLAIYQACDEDSCIYLVGAMHIGKEEMDGLTDKIWEAYDECDALAVEVDTISLSLLQQLEMTSMMISEDQTDLDTYFTEEQLKEIEDFLAEYGITMEDARSLTVVGLYNSINSLTQQNFPVAGTDSQLLMKAHSDNKEIIELETLEFQLNLLYGGTNEEYVEVVMSLIEQFDEELQAQEELYNAYISGDVAELEKVLFADENQEVYQELFYDRNIPMADKAEVFLKENKNVMITVGAGHIIGDKGIAHLLEERGYEVSLVK